MNASWWFMAAYHELESEPVVRAPEPEPEPVVEAPVEPGKPVRLSCPKCGKTGRGIVIHIRNCKG